MRRATCSHELASHGWCYFYPRSPCGERRASQGADFGHKMNFYPRSPCGERRWLRCWQLAARDISIHALLAESDYSLVAVTPSNFLFLSTLSLRRATVEKVPADVYYQAFLSTLSLRRATCRNWQKQSIHHKFLSTLSLRRATGLYLVTEEDIQISIHALLAESDKRAEIHANSQQEFLSTLSLRRATSN